MRYWLIVLSLLIAAPAWAVDIPPTDTTNEIDGDCTSGGLGRPAHLEMDEGADTPGGDWCAADSDSADQAMFLWFDVPPLDEGVDSQQWALYLKQSNPGGNNPTIRIATYDGIDCADFYKNGAWKNITSSSGQLLTWDFGGSDLDVGDGKVCAYLTCEHAGGSPTNRNSCDFDAMELRAVIGATPTTSPTISPTNTPTISPTVSPSPTISPTVSPTISPGGPTATPTSTPPATGVMLITQNREVSP